MKFKVISFAVCLAIDIKIMLVTRFLTSTSSM